MKRVAQWSFFRAPELEESGIAHGFCTGSSPADLVLRGMGQAFLDAFALKNLAMIHQEHGDRVHVVGEGAKPLSGDGLVLVERNVAGIIRTADCLPIILCDVRHPMASIIHAGWRGTAKGIINQAIGLMEKLGSRRGDMVALLGPAIGSCCYEVGEDVHGVFARVGFPESVFHHDNCSLFLDLKLANAWLLREGGINKIHDLAMCTRCNGDLFFSFRRGDKTKRQINFVYLKG